MTTRYSGIPDTDLARLYQSHERFIEQTVASIHGTLTGADIAKRDELISEMTTRRLLEDHHEN